MPFIHALNYNCTFKDEDNQFNERDVDNTQEFDSDEEDTYDFDAENDIMYITRDGLIPHIHHIDKITLWVPCPHSWRIVGVIRTTRAKVSDTNISQIPIMINIWVIDDTGAVQKQYISNKHSGFYMINLKQKDGENTIGMSTNGMKTKIYYSNKQIESCPYNELKLRYDANNNVFA